MTVHNFSNGWLNPGVGYLLSCLGAFLGLRCLTRARAYSGGPRAIWLLIASVSIGATGIWAMHFVAMLGFTVPGQQILYSVPTTLISLLVAVAVVAIALFIVGYGGGGPRPVLAGGMIIGLGVASMHYVGMSAMSMTAIVRYNPVLVGLSVLIAIVTGTAALVAGLHVRGIWASIGVSLIMGVAVSGMHYTGMAAMEVYRGSGGMTLSGVAPDSFIFPLLIGASALTFLISLTIAVSPNEEEIHADLQLSRRLAAAAEARGAVSYAEMGYVYTPAPPSADDDDETDSQSEAAGFAGDLTFDPGSLRPFPGDSVASTGIDHAAELPDSTSWDVEAMS